MPLSESDKRVLVSRAEGLEAGGFLDHLCNGLVSRWQAAHRSDRAPKRGEFVWLRPVYAPVGDAFIWIDSAEIPWSRLKRWVADDAEIFYLGTMAESEIRAGREVFPRLTAFALRSET